MPRPVPKPRGTFRARPGAGRGVPSDGGRNGRNTTIARTRVHRATGKPVRDADTEMVITLTDADVKKSKTADPFNCALATACKLQYNAPFAEVRRSMAYVDMGDYIARFTFAKQTAVYIAAFDLTGVFPAGEYWFMPPSRTMRFDSPSRNKGSSRGKFGTPKTKHATHQPVVGSIRASGRNDVMERAKSDEQEA